MAPASCRRCNEVKHIGATMKTESTKAICRAANMLWIAALVAACGGGGGDFRDASAGAASVAAHALAPEPVLAQDQAQAKAQAENDAVVHEQLHAQANAKADAQAQSHAAAPLAAAEGAADPSKASVLETRARRASVAPTAAAASSCATAHLPSVEEGCNGADLLSSANTLERSAGVESIAGPTPASAYRFNASHFFELAGRDCLRLGRSDSSFAVSGWVRLPEGASSVLTIKSGKDPLFSVVSALERGKLQLRVTTRAPGAAAPRILKTGVVAGRWTHVALNYRNLGESSSVELWVDSNRFVESAYPSVHAADARIYVGNHGVGEPVEIAQLRSYSKLLTPRDVASLLKESSAGADTSPALLGQGLAQLNQHFSGTRLSDLQFKSAVAEVTRNQFFLSESEAMLRQGLDLIDRFESVAGPLFISPADRTLSPGNAEQAARAAEQFGMLEVQQAVLDNAWLADNVQACRALFEGRAWKASHRFPGAVARPADPTRELKARVDGTVARHKGRWVFFAQDPAKRPTGLYLAPGSVAEVRVPLTLVNKGFAVLVGSHNADHSTRTSFVRLHRVQRRFEIAQEVTLIANPMGGLINIEVPYLANAGLVDITVRNAVEAPMFSMRSFDKTTVEQWQSRRTAPGAFAEFVTDNVWLQLPREFIYAMDDPTAFLTEWDRAMQGVNELMGFAPGTRNRTAHYMAMDLAMRAGVAGVGYPSNNNPWNPNFLTGGQSGHALITQPVGSWLEYHELGHAHTLKGFEGERESNVHILLFYVLNKTFGIDLDEAFRRSALGPFKPDDAAIQWMFTNEFRAGQQMRHETHFDQFSYRHRGHAKYADMARIFGWDATVKFYRLWNQEIDGEIPAITGLGANDARMLRMSIAAGADVRPLIHFWGIFPQDPAALEARIKASGLAPSPAIRAQLLRYRNAVVPADNAAYQTVFTRLYPNRPTDGDVNIREWNHWLSRWDESHAAQVRAQIDKVIALYYP
jgi:hypothetical protein